MPSRHHYLLVTSLTFVVGAVARPAAALEAGQGSPAAEVFAPGVISGPANDGSPTFSPDGNTLFFTRSAARWSIILESHRSNKGWSEPVVAPFSGQWSDASPAMAPDGSYLVFVSVRPQTAKGGKAAPPSASHIWRVNRVGSGWSPPTELPESVNFCRDIFRPSLAADGSVYFVASEQGKQLRLFRSSYEKGGYLKAEPLPFSDGSVKDVDPEIAPDQSFVVFSSKGRRPGEAEHEHLFIVFNRAGRWGEVTPVRYDDDEAFGSSDDSDPRLGADHKTLYFSSDRTVRVRFPRTAEEARHDFERLQTWDNNNANVWSLSLGRWLTAAHG